MKQKLTITWIPTLVLITMLQLSMAAAQNNFTGSDSASPLRLSGLHLAATAEPSPNVDSPNNPKHSAKLPPIADQVLKLYQAGVSNTVIEAYIAQAPVTRPLSAPDVLVLKQKGVPDELAVALLKRAAPSATAARQGQQRPPPAAANAVAPPPSSQVTPPSAFAGMDPESYEFWWYHYAYPRALAAANERLFSSYQQFYRYPADYGFYGFYPPLAFPPQPPGRFGAP